MAPIVRRFLVPRPAISAYCFLRYGSYVSPRAEVEVGRGLALGRGSTVGSFSKIKVGTGRCEIGDDVSIATNCFISAESGDIRIGQDCLIGPGVAIVAGSYRYDSLDVPFRLQGHVARGVWIGDNVWIGSNCSVLAGAHIESGVIISANSVVASHISRNAIVQGNPATVIYVRK